MTKNPLLTQTVNRIVREYEEMKRTIETQRLLIIRSREIIRLLELEIISLEKEREKKNGLSS